MPPPEPPPTAPTTGRRRGDRHRRRGGGAERDPTVGAGIADTRGVVTSYAPIVAAEFVGTAVLDHVRARAAPSSPPRPRPPRRGPRLRLRPADHGLRHRADQRLPHQPGDHARDAAGEEDHAPPRRATPGSPRCSAAIFGADRDLRHRQRPRRLGARDRSPPTAGTATASAGSGAMIVVEIVFTALFVFVVLTTTGRRFAPGFGGLVAGHHAGRDPPGHDPGRQHERQPGAQPRHGDLRRHRPRARSASCGRSSCSR